MSDLAVILQTGICGGNQLAYDVTAVMVGPAEINFERQHVTVGLPDPHGDQDYLALVTGMLAQTVAQRMTARASAKVAGSPLLKAVATTTGLPLVAASASHALTGNALVYLSDLTANDAEEVVLIVTCAGLSQLHCERYAEMLAAMCKFTLLGELASRNAARLTDMADAA